MKNKLIYAALFVLVISLAFSSGVVLADNETPTNQDGYIVKVRSNAKLSPSLASKIKNPSPDGNGVTVISEDDYSHLSASDKSNFEYIEPNTIVSLSEMEMKSFASSATADLSNRWHLPLIGVDKVRKSFPSTGNPVIVAIVDTGVRLDHPDLVDNLIEGANFIPQSSSPMDDHGHGTHVAGIVNGNCPNCLLMPVKVLDMTGHGPLSVIADGIYYAANHGAKVINLSLGSYTPSQALCDAVSFAQSQNAIVVAASGNDGDDTVLYPANCNADVVKVGATGYYDEKVFYSNTGHGIDLVAPGGTAGDKGILSTCLLARYCYMSGTSMATPNVAGAIGLYWSFNPGKTPREVVSALLASVSDLGVKGYDNNYGYGRLDVARLMGLVPNPYATAMSDNQPTISYDGGDLKVVFYARADAGVQSVCVNVIDLVENMTCFQKTGEDTYSGVLHIPSQPIQTNPFIFRYFVDVTDTIGQHSVLSTGGVFKMTNEPEPAKTNTVFIPIVIR